MFSLKTTLMILDQVLTTISKVHEWGYLHLHLSMDTLAIGAENMNKYIYIIGLGYAQNLNESGEILLFKRKSPNEFSPIQFHNGGSYSK